LAIERVSACEVVGAKWRSIDTLRCMLLLS
jgi:hypothetical protein